MDKLTQYLQTTGGEGYEYGFSDCAPWVCRWIAIAQDREINHPPYNSRAESVRLIREAGGIVELFDIVAQRNGLIETDNPKRGDIAILSHAGAFQNVILAICLCNGKWAGKAQDGKVFTFSSDVIKAWKIA